MHFVHAFSASVCRLQCDGWASSSVASQAARRSSCMRVTGVGSRAFGRMAWHGAGLTQGLAHDGVAGLVEDVVARGHVHRVRVAVREAVDVVADGRCTWCELSLCPHGELQ